MTLKKKFTLGFALIMLLALAVMGTYAYLTSETTPAHNTFTVGNVEISLTEAAVDEYGDEDTTATERVKENTYKLIPGHSYTKDPTIFVTDDSEDCYVFAKVEDGLAEIEGEDTIAEQLVNSYGWTALPGVDGVYYQEATGGDVLTVFSYFTIKDDADVSGYGDAAIDITGYAVQKDGFPTAADAWAATFGAE